MNERPWEAAKEGEVWELSVGHANRAFLVQWAHWSDLCFTDYMDANWPTDAPEITAGRRIYPEDDS